MLILFAFTTEEAKKVRVNSKNNKFSKEKSERRSLTKVLECMSLLQEATMTNLVVS